MVTTTERELNERRQNLKAMWLRIGEMREEIDQMRNQLGELTHDVPTYEGPSSDNGKSADRLLDDATRALLRVRLALADHT